MAIENEIAIAGLLFVFSYLVLYKLERILGYIGYVSTGLIILAYSTDTTYAATGVIIILTSIIAAIVDTFKNKN